MKALKGLSRVMIMAIAVGALTPILAYAAGDVEITEATFPDQNLRAAVSSEFDTDGNGILSEEEIANATYLDVSGVPLTTAKGIEHLTALTDLMVDNTGITNIDLSGNAQLLTLSVAGNSLTELDVSPCPDLAQLYCQNNQLTSLDLSHNPAINTLNYAYNHLACVDLNASAFMVYLETRGNFREIHPARQFDLSVIPGFDITKVNLDATEGGSFDVAANTFTFDEGIDTATYRYQLSLIDYTDRGSANAPTQSKTEGESVGYYSTFTFTRHQHVATLISGMDPTCIQSGIHDVYYCEDCGDTYLESAPDVSVTDDDLIISALGHDFGEWVITTQPGKDAEGLATRMCTRCGATEEKTLAALEIFQPESIQEPEKYESTAIACLPQTNDFTAIFAFVSILALISGFGILVIEYFKLSE